MSEYKLDIQKQIKKITADFNALPEYLEKAASRGLNKTANWLKGKVSKDISKSKRIKLKIVRERIEIFRAYKHNLQAVFRINDLSIPVIKFSNVVQTDKGIVAGGYFLKSAFFATMKRGNKGVYKRVGKKRLPIYEQKISLSEDLEKVLKQILESNLENQFEKYFEHEFKYITGVI